MREGRAYRTREAHFGTCVGGCFIGGGFKIPDVAEDNTANSTAATQTQLAITCFLKPPPLRPPRTQVPNAAVSTEPPGASFGGSLSPQAEHLSPGTPESINI